MKQIPNSIFFPTVLLLHILLKNKRVNQLLWILHEASELQACILFMYKIYKQMIKYSTDMQQKRCQTAIYKSFQECYYCLHWTLRIIHFQKYVYKDQDIQYIQTTYCNKNWLHAHKNSFLLNPWVNWFDNLDPKSLLLSVSQNQ